MDGRIPYRDSVKDGLPEISTSEDLFAHEKLLDALKDGPLAQDDLVQKFQFGEEATVKILDGQKKRGMVVTYDEDGKTYYRLTERGEYKVKLTRGEKPIILKKHMLGG